MFDFTVVGHFCLDYFKGREEFPDYIRLGGTTVYASRTAQKLSKNVGVISSVGPDFNHELIEPLKKDGIDIHLINSNLNSTAFIHEYVKNERILTLKSRCKIIEDLDIPEKYLNSKIFLIGAIANEVDTSVLTKISQLNVQIGLDLHGFVRKFDKNGKMSQSDWLEAENYLQNVTFLKCTEKEGRVLTGLKNLQEIAIWITSMGPKVVVITRGRKGSFIYSNNISLQIPPIVNKIVDETGAGDTYFTAFILDFIENEDLYHAALFGASAASYVMEEQGPFGFASKDEIEKRIQEFINK